MHHGYHPPYYFLMSLQTEVLHSPPISQLPKNILKAPPVDPASADGDQRYKGMLVPKQSGKLKVPDEEDRYFTETDAAAKEYEQLVGGGIEKIVRRLVKRYSGILSLGLY